jgi:hypothetical protein
VRVFLRCDRFFFILLEVPELSANELREGTEGKWDWERR